jgi:hypothetical protein
MNTQELLEEMQTKYPNIKFYLDKKTNLGLEGSYSEEEVEKAPDYLISFESGGIGIWDPYASECSRFKVNPEEEYGITEEDARKIANHNLLHMH